MGILHSIIRFLGCKTEDEEAERTIYPYPVLTRRQNYYPCTGNSSSSSDRVRKISSLLNFIYNTWEGLMQKVRFILYLPRPRETADPILPLQNPAPRVSNDPLLVQTLLISSPISDSSAESSPERAPTTFAPFVELDADEEVHDLNVDVGYSKQWPEENYSTNIKQKDYVMVSIADFTYSLAYTNASEEIMDSAVFTEEIAPQNAPSCLEESTVMNSLGGKGGEEEEERQKERVMIKSTTLGGKGEGEEKQRQRECVTIKSATLGGKGKGDEKQRQREWMIKSATLGGKGEGEEKQRQRECVTIKSATLGGKGEGEEKQRQRECVTIGKGKGEEKQRQREWMIKSTTLGGKGKEEEKQRQPECVMIESTIVVDEGKWIKHYSSHHRILLVGEGDFSFSACLAVAFGWASNMIATSLDSQAFLKGNYQNAPSNIEELRSRECKVMHGIDATKMANHPMLGHLTLDRIIYNFPFAGFFNELPRESQLKRHRRLVSLFLKNAKEMMSNNGEIHISHKTNGFHKEFNLESLASSHGLRLIEAVDFDQLDYPGYNTKYGFGGDNNFNCNPSKTHKFGHKNKMVVRYT